MHEDDRPMDADKDEAMQEDGSSKEIGGLGRNTGQGGGKQEKQSQDELAIFENIENEVKLQGEAQSEKGRSNEEWLQKMKEQTDQIIEQAKKEKEAGANDGIDLDRDDDSAEFAFEDAIDQPLEDDDLKTTEAEKSQEKFNFDQIIEKIENPQNVKKSFELRYQNDDDDDIFIVHDGEEEDEGEKEDDQDNLFMEPPSMSFNIIEENGEEKAKESQKEEQDEGRTSPTGEFEKIEFSLKDF